MQVGDNMLAIYASEKALRLAESLGEARAASRAHGIFGRVFGRIGDAAKARENLERAVELARQSDEEETVLALLALGPQPRALPRATTRAAGARYREALALAERIGERAGADRAAVGPRPSWPSTAATGRRSAAPATPARSWPNARGWSASCACRTSCAGGCAGARATGTPPTRLFSSARELAEPDRLVGGHLQRADRRSPPRNATAASWSGPRRRWARRWRSASAPAWSPSRCRHTRLAR